MKPITLTVGIVLLVTVILSPASGYPSTPDSTTMLAVQANIDERWDDLAALVDPESLADFSRTFIHCSGCPSGLMFRKQLFGDSAGVGVSDRKFYAGIMAALREKNGGPSTAFLSMSRCHILGSIVSGDTTFVVYRISHPSAPQRPFAVTWSLRKTQAGYTLIPFFGVEDALVDLGLQCGGQ